MLATWAFLIGLLAMGDTNTDPETYSMIVPDGPISAPLGASITLPCSVSPAFSVVPHKIRWYRPNKFDTPILLYENRKVQKDPSDAQYRGRVSLVGQLDQGNVSMRLNKLTLADRGEYVCYVHSTVWFEEGTVSVIAEVVGTLPVLSVSSGEEDKVNVTCMSEGWSPQPTLTWTGGGGESITLYHTVYSTDEQGLVRVSSWLLHSPSESEWLSCSVGLSDQDRREGRVVPYVCTTHKGSTGAVVVGVISALVVLILVVIIVFLYRKGLVKKMKRKKTQKEDNTTRCDHTTHASASELEGLISGQTDDLKKKEEELTTLQQEKEELLENLKKEREKNTGLTDDLKKKEDEIINLQQEKKDLQGELDETIAALRKDKNELQAELHETKSRLEKEKRDLQDKLDETITGWQKDKEVLTDDLNKNEDEASNLQQEKKDLRDKLDETTAWWQKDKEGLTDYLKKMEDQFSVLQQEKKDLQDKLDETIAVWQKDKEGLKLKDDEKAMIEKVAVIVGDVDFNTKKWLKFQEGEMRELLEKIWSDQRKIMKEDSRYLKEIMTKDAEHQKKELLDKLNKMETFITKTRTTIKQDLEYLGSRKTKLNVEESK